MTVSQTTSEPIGRGRRRIMKLVRRGESRPSGKFLALEVPEGDEISNRLFGGAHGSVPCEIFVCDLGSLYGYLWVDSDGRLFYEPVIEDPTATSEADRLIHEAHAYQNPKHWGVFSSTYYDPDAVHRNPSAEEVAWKRQGMLANQVYSKLMWMPLEARTTHDELTG